MLLPFLLLLTSFLLLVFPTFLSKVLLILASLLLLYPFYR
jgi:hypothetical protein